MTANRNKTNKADRSSKKIVTAVGLAIAVITLVTVFLFVKDPLFVSLASKATLNGKLDAAERYLVVCSGEESEFLADYVALRRDINADYVNMRSNFSHEKIEEWQKRAAKLSKKCDFANAELEEQVKNLSEKLNGISLTLADYDALRPEIMGLFDIFNEANRLYTKDATGQNSVFTIEQELAAIAEWEETARKLDDFTADTVNGEKMYLLTFFVKEAQGEAADLRSSMNGFVAQGYAPDAQMRVTGSLSRTFPSIQNSNGILVNLQHKETYESCMYQGMCVALTDSLGEFIV